MQTGEKIKKYIIAKRMTQKELSEKLNLPTFRIGQYETGIRKSKNDCLEKIADVLEVPCYKLRGYDISSFDVAEELLNDIVLECGKEFVLEYLEKME